MVKNKSKVFVTGHKGLVGSAVVRKLTDRGYKNIITVTKDKLDLRNQKEVFNFFQKKKLMQLSTLQVRQGEFLQTINIKLILFMTTQQFKIILFMLVIRIK